MAAPAPWMMLLLALGTAGCVSAREREASPDAAQLHLYLADKPSELRRHFAVAQAQGPRNRVLNHMRLGLATFALEKDGLSAELLDDALTGIEAIYADTPEARKARDLWTRESIKDFKGEPYERAMAYYYRGLLYLRGGDYDNARASFKGGMLQDAFAEEEQYRADFALMPFLQGWAAHCRGDDSLAAEDYREFHSLNADIPLPGAKDNILVLVETGTGPVKVSDGPRLKIRRAGSSDTARVSWSDPSRPKDHPSGSAFLLEDIYRQASTRGGRPFDAILEGKAEYKDAADTAGNIALIGAAVAARVAVEANSRPPYQSRRRLSPEERAQRSEIQQGAAIISGVLGLFGLASKAAAKAMEVEADTRYWDNLSDRVHGITLSLPESVSSLHVEFLSPGGTSLGAKDAPIRRAGRCGLAWVRDGAVIPRNPRAPNSVPPDIMASPVQIPEAPRLVTQAPPDAPQQE